MSPKILPRLLVFLPVAFAPGFAEPARETLPAGVIPLHYDLALVPDTEKLTFRGQVLITINVKATVPAIVLNADELVLDKALIDKSGRPAAVAYDKKLQRATLTFAQPVARGRHVITLDYHGAIGVSTLGFFAMDYDSPGGKRRTLATNFEPASERRFMPSWDEPGFKATFSITVDVPKDRMAVANMPAASTETLPNGQTRVHFATTPKMSTYLLFLAVGDFERISAKIDGTDIGVVTNKGDGEKGRYALGEAGRLLHYYNDYFGVRYPLPKLDLVVAPGAIAGGSMENWGAIFYSEEHLLFDPKTSTEEDRQLVFLVVSHEMSHQWFGDLVTMSWWDNLWLNEGFARWMQTKAADDLHPEWKMGLQALAIAESGKRADAKPSTHPIVQTVLTASQAELAFDEITYDKGATVIGMLESYAGPTAFREGIRRYMRAHAYGNTVDADLWREVQAAAGKPVLEVEADFTRQPGVPLLRVEAELGSGVSVLQGRFAEDPATIANAPAQQWHIPIAVSAGGASVNRLLASAGPTSIAADGSGPVIVNAGQAGYVRVLYPQSMVAALSSGMGKVKTVDQLGVLYDGWALGQSGYAPLTNYLELARAVPADADPLVLGQVVSTLVLIEGLYEEAAGRGGFVRFALEILHPLGERLGWDARPSEDANAPMLRNGVLVALGEFGDKHVIAEARRRFEMSLQNPGDVSPAVRRTALSIVARESDKETLDRLIALLLATHDPLEKLNIFRALERVTDPAGAERVLELAIGSDAPAGTTAQILIGMAEAHPDLTWRFAMQHAEQIAPLRESSTRLTMMPDIASQSNDPKRAGELRAYAEKEIPASARQSVEAAVASIELHAKFRAERLREIDAWLATRPGR
jgi:aminopeptidase N